jgi:hypothetical protein
LGFFEQFFFAVSCVRSLEFLRTYIHTTIVLEGGVNFCSLCVMHYVVIYRNDV